VVKDSLGIDKDNDMVVADSASMIEAQLYEKGEGNGPDPKALLFELRHPKSTAWNQRVIAILLEKFRENEREEDWGLPVRSDAYVLELFQNRYKRIREAWQKGQFRVKPSGERETREEWSERIMRGFDEENKKHRHSTRTGAVSI
jgi:hypothetical protein